MALRIETVIGPAVGVLLLLAMGSANAQTAGVQTAIVSHSHLRHSGEGQLVVNPAGIRFTERGKHAGHSREWRFTDIQQLTLKADEIRILTYEDQKYQLGRDREYVFEDLPAGFAESIASVVSHALGQRFVDAMAGQQSGKWRVEAKLLHKITGVDGVLIADEQEVTFKGKDDGESRTWPITSIDSISSTGPYDLTITAYERTRWAHANTSDFHFELKEPLPRGAYDGLWSAVNQAKGWKDLTALLGKTGEHHTEPQTHGSGLEQPTNSENLSTHGAEPRPLGSGLEQRTDSDNSNNRKAEPRPLGSGLEQRTNSEHSEHSR